MQPPEHHTRDAALIPAPIEDCFAALADLGSYARWWTLVAVAPVSGTSRLAPGVRFRFSGARPGGAVVCWDAEVLTVDPPGSIELAYVAGSLLGRTAWELVTEGAGTRVAYVYRGVRAGSPDAAASFARFGTRLHSVAMREDALAGLARYLGGPGAELDDEAWRARVAARVASGVRAIA